MRLLLVLVVGYLAGVVSLAVGVLMGGRLRRQQGPRRIWG